MKFKFQSFFDIQTSATSMQVIQWSVGGAEVYNRCRHLFGAYKYFRLGKISVKMVPASTLPVDPLGLSYATDNPQTVDPRDQMNPGLVRITNGEDVFTNVSALGADQQIRVYNAMMLDPRWSKFMLQSGFRRSAYPLYWQVGQLSQDKYPGATINIPDMPNGTGGGDGGTTVERAVSNTSSSHALVWNGQWDSSSARGLFQVGHKGKLGYLPTDYFQQVPNAAGAMQNDMYGPNNVPEVSVITCVLPKAYKTIYYYRVFVTEEVYFAGLRSAPIEGNCGIDNFLMGVPTPTKPGYPIQTQVMTDNKMNNGDVMP